LPLDFLEQCVMKIAVVSMRGGAGGGGLSAEFDSTGGTIGRAASNQLVLDDPDRTVSRVHAQIVNRNGQFFIVDRGSNPLLCNGVSLGSGNEAALLDGTKLQIGNFELVVSHSNAHKANATISDDLTFSPSGGPAKAAPSSDDPFADLLFGLAPAPAPAAVATPKSIAAPSPNSNSAFFPDPMGLDTPAAKTGKADPFDDLMGFGATGTGSRAGAVPSGGGAFDGLPNASSSSLDDLFGLGSATVGGDPFADSPLASPKFQPNTASSADPLHALLGDGPKASAATRSDHVPALQHAYSLPAAVDAKPKTAPAPNPQPPPPAAKSVPAYSAPVQVHAAPNSKVAPRAPGSATVAADSELLAAFLRGVKSTHQMPTELTPELMERIGAMLHTATNGTLQLLLSRQEFKKVLQSEVTMISMVANNPLKFSPNAEVALAHMLGPKVKGFMGAEESMTNAYADLRAHQFGVMVGMRAALSHVLGRFTPDSLEKRLTEKSKLDEFFSASRKAKLWDQFCKLYAGIASEAEDDFHTLFGKAFSKAYDEQMARFKSE
jgi:type VI secretion system FHA domain protein